jgi:ribosomal protein L32E
MKGQISMPNAGYRRNKKKPMLPHGVPKLLVKELESASGVQRV